MIIKDNLDCGFVFLAPMAGITDAVYRNICKKHGADMVYTEMVSASGLYYNDAKSIEMLRAEVLERPVALQIFGSDPKIMSEAVKRQVNQLENVDLLDINMGCPAPKIVNNGNGSALMKNIVLAGEIVEAVVRASEKPVTVKFRKGWDDNSVNAVEFAKMLEQSGANAITVHGRTREQFYSGLADWDIIGEVKSAVNIPVIGNGDIFNAEDAVNMLRHTGCDGIMVGRGCQGNPWIFEQIKQKLNSQSVNQKVKDVDKIYMCIFHLRKMVEYKGERIAVKEMRKHIGWYIKGLKNATEIRRKSNYLNTEKEVVDLMENYIIYLSREDV